MANTLNIGSSGLLTFQRSLATVSHNISNANTPGYTRQNTQLSAIPGQSLGNAYIGRGVGISGVTQIRDQFVEQRLREAITDSSRSELFLRFSEQINNLLGQRESGLAPALQEFFDATHGVSADPTSTTARQLLLTQGQALVDRFQFLDSQLQNLMRDSNRELEVQVAQINAIAGDIARINRDIVNAQGVARGNAPNDLLDQRNTRINDLAALVSIDPVPQDNGAINVFTGNGQPLVINMSARTLSTATDPLNQNMLQVTARAGATTVEISNQLNGGAIGGLLDFRRDALLSTRDELGRIAVVLADSFNAQHRKGMDINGALGQDFFSVPPAQSFANRNNTGVAALSVSYTNTANLQATDYRLDYDGLAFTLTRSSDGVSVTGPGPLTLDGFQVAISAGAVAGDSFLIRPVARGAQLLGLNLKDPNMLASAAPVRAGAQSGNLGSAGIEQPQVDDVSNPALRDAVDIIFQNPPSTFDVVDVATSTVLAAGVAYGNGQTFSYNGWSTRIAGSPEVGDVFRIEDNSGGTADNRNALALADLQGAVTVAGNLSYGDAYSNLVGQVGIATRSAQLNAGARGALLDSAMTARDQVSGVNLDEEAIDLIRFQQAYQAMAQVISTSNSLFDTLLASFR